MKRNTKIVKYLILVSLLLFTRQAGATGGRSETIHLPGIFFSEGHIVPHSCVESVEAAPTEADDVGAFFDPLFSLYKSVGDLLIQNNAEIHTGNSPYDYYYYLTINGKSTKTIEEYSLESPTNFIRRFFQRINDDVLRRFGGDKQRVKLEKVQFPVDGFTIHLGSFETKKEAVKFKRNLGRELSRAIAKLARKFEAKNLEGLVSPDSLFCASCLFQGNLSDDTDLVDNIEVPEIVLKPYASNDWRVSFGLFIREEDANAAIKTVEKFYRGQVIVQKIKIDGEMIYRQIELFSDGCNLIHSWGR